ncbi:MAG: serine hydrolase domain-containing protein [Rhodospirillales bacterium]
MIRAVTRLAGVGIAVLSGFLVASDGSVANAGPTAVAAADVEFVEVCLGPSGRPDKQKVVSLPKRAAMRLIERGKATAGPCTPATLVCNGDKVRVGCGEVATMRADAILQSEQEEEINALVLKDEGPRLPIDDRTSVPPRPSVMGQCIDDAYAQEAEVGYAYAIAQNGQLADTGAGGFAVAPWEDDPSVVMTEATRMTIASVSKPITAVAVMKMLEQFPALGLDDPFYPLIAGKFGGPFFFGDGTIADIPGPGVDQVTIRHLLTHRSGLKPGLGCGFAKLGTLLAIGVVGTPGSTYDYENSNFCLLREVVEQVTGIDYVDYVEANILQPMGIAAMSCEEDDVEPARYYNTIQGPGTTFGDYVGTCSAYGWYASAIDLARFLANVRFNTVLTQASQDAMLGDCPNPGDTGDYCLGWMRRDTTIGLHHLHNGDWFTGDPCAPSGGDIGGIVVVPSECRKGFNGTIMQLPLGIDASLLVNTREGTNFNPGLKSEVTILRECFKQAFLDANPGSVVVGGAQGSARSGVGATR